ncbi:MAG: alpha/beta fold hydrolase [Bryobacterales bacterium]|nr:alpha/beta fold hydrolase [Bryobacterales bacterium]
MPRRIETVSIAGPAGRLEGLLEEPGGRDPAMAAVVCHPHPLHGGTMHNKVVYRIARGLRRAGAVVLRFNFRGVNLSEGAHDGGTGEIEDARAALAFLRERYPHLPYLLAGFSFGSRIVLRLGCQLPEPAPSTLIAAGYPTVHGVHGFLRECGRPKIFIQSTHDEFGPMDELAELVTQLPEAHVRWVEARDHFFAGSLDEFEKVVMAAGEL